MFNITFRLAKGSTEHLQMKHKKYSSKFKLDVVAYAKQNSVNGAATKFGIHRKSVQEWKKQEARLIDIQNPRKHFRLEGNGRKIKNNKVEEGVLQFFKGNAREKVVCYPRKITT